MIENKRVLRNEMLHFESEKLCQPTHPVIERSFDLNRV